MLRSAKDGAGLRVPGVCRIPRDCGNVYLGHSGRTVDDRCKEHKRFIRQHQPEKSAVADHSISTGHCFDFCGTSLLDRTSWYFVGLVKEAVEIRLTENNCNTDAGFILSHAWSPITMFMNVKAGPHKAGTWLRLQTLLSRYQLWAKGAGRYVYITTTAGPLACWDLGFESHRGHGYLSVVSVVCCQVEV